MFVLFLQALHVHILQLGEEGAYEHFAARSLLQQRGVLLLHQHLEVHAHHQQHGALQYLLLLNSVLLL